MEVWTRAVYLVEVFPFTGVGMGLYANVADILYPLVFASSEKVLHVHNLFLQIAVDLGLPGLIAWLSILLVLFTASWNLYRSGRKRNDPWAAGLGAGFFCSLLALVLHGLTDAVVWGMVRPAPLVWVVWGGAVASSIVYAAQPGRDHPAGKSVQQIV
jgi:putative inorganic carbon (HCO3(-)) transporter